MKKFSEYSDTQLAEMLMQKKSIAEQGFAEIYSRYSQRIYAYCFKIMGNEDDARDIFQDTFMRFFKTAQNKLISDNIPGYLITIARNLCLNHKRDKKPTESLGDYQAVFYEDEYGEKEVLEIIDKTLDKMGFDYKEPFILRQYQGYSYQEIAAITGISESAVKNRVWRAKEKIKSVLAPYLEDMYN